MSPAVTASRKGLSLDRTEHLVRCLKKIAEMLGKDFDEADREDIVEVVRRIEARRISAWTKHDYRAALKKFYKWLKGGGDEYSEGRSGRRSCPRSCSQNTTLRR